MRLQFLLAATSLVRKPARALFSVLGVAMGIAAVVAIFTVDHNTILHLQPDVATEGNYSADLVVRPTGDAIDPSAALLEQPGILEATRVKRAEIVVRVGAVEVPARLVALDLGRAARMGVLRSTDGSLTGGRAGLVVGERLAERLELAAGGTLEVAVLGRGPAARCVDGEMLEIGEEVPATSAIQLDIHGLIADESIGRAAAGMVVCMEHDLAVQLFGARLTPLELWAARDPAVDLERLQRGLTQSFGSYDMRAGAVVGQEADERAFRNGVRLSGLMTLALGLYVIFHTLSMSLTERLRDVGVLHALGASRRQIAGCFFVEAVLIAFAAGAVGLGGGLLLARLMLARGITSLGLSKTVSESFDVPWNQVLVLSGIGVAIALLGSVFPLLRAQSTNAVQALRGEASHDERGQRRFQLFAALLLLGVLPAVFFSVVDLVGEGSRDLLEVVLLGVGVLVLLFATPLLVPGAVALSASWIARLARTRLPFAGLLAARSMSHGRLRVAACVSALTLLATAFVGLTGITASLRQETVEWAGAALANKVWVSGLGDVDVAQVRDALDHPDVLGFELGDHRVDVGFRIQSIGPDAATFGPLAEDDGLRALALEGRGIFVSNRLAVQQGWKLGDDVTLVTPGTGAQSFTICAVGEPYGYFRDPHERAYAVIGEQHLARYYCIDVENTGSVAVRFRTDRGLTEGDRVLLAEALLRPLAAQGVVPRVMGAAEIRAREVFDVTRDFLVFHVILLLTAALAGLGLLNAQLLATSERVKELGVLRALGAAHRQIAGSVLLESTAVGLVGGVFGLALGAAITPAVVRTLKVLSGLDLPQPGFAAVWALVPIGTVLLAIAAAIFPVWRLRRASPAAAVRAG
jgi:putative ABC transport system permease protein